MKKLFQMAVLFGIAAFLICPARSQNTNVAANTNSNTATANKNAVVFTNEDREKGLKYLQETTDLFLKEISGLSEAQLNFKESPERWSVAEVAEHIVVAENRIFSLITEKIVKEPAPVGKENFRLQDTAIWMAITNRNTKFTAPEPVQPKGNFKTKADILKGFKETRAKTAEFLKNTDEDLRNRFGTLPVIGTIDGFQWFVFINAHGYRHLEQIKEIKAHPDFPAK